MVGPPVQSAACLVYLYAPGELHTYTGFGSLIFAKSAPHLHRGHLVLCVLVSPVAEDAEETHQVLRYAALATAINMAVNAPGAGGAAEPGLG